MSAWRLGCEKRDGCVGAAEPPRVRRNVGPGSQKKQRSPTSRFSPKSLALDARRVPEKGSVWWRRGPGRNDSLCEASGDGSASGGPSGNFYLEDERAPQATRIEPRAPQSMVHTVPVRFCRGANEASRHNLCFQQSGGLCREQARISAPNHMVSLLTSSVCVHAC